MVYYVFFTTNDGRKDMYWGHYSSEKKAQDARRFILSTDDNVRSVMVEYRRT